MVLSKKQKEWWIRDFSPEAQAVFDLMPTTPSTLLKIIMAPFIDSQVASGNWLLNNFEFILYGSETEPNSLTGWRGLANAINVASTPHVPWSGVTHSGFAGFQPDGVAKYINTDIAPDSQGQNDIISGFWLFERGAGGALPFGVQSASNNTRFHLNESSPNSFYRVNANNFGTITGLAALADHSLHSIARPNSANAEYVLNDVQTDTEARASQGRSALNIYDGAQNNDGTASGFYDGDYTVRYIAPNTGFDRSSFFDNLLIMLQAMGIEA